MNNLKSPTISLYFSILIQSPTYESKRDMCAKVVLTNKRSFSDPVMMKDFIKLNCKIQNEGPIYTDVSHVHVVLHTCAS